MGLLDLLDSGQAQLGLGLLAAAGPRSDGANFGQRMLEGVGHTQSWKQQQAKQKMYDLQMQEAQMKMEEMKRKQEEGVALAAREAKFNQGVGQFFKPSQPALSPLMGDAETGIMPSQGRAAVAPSIDQQGLGMFMAQNGRLEDGIKLLTPKAGPKFSTAPQYDQNGRAFIIAEDGSMKYLDGVKARDKLQEVRLGDKVGFRTDYSPDIQGSLPIGQSPDSKAPNALGWANNSLSRQRFAFDQAGGTEGGKPPAGYRWNIDRSGLEAIPGGPADQKAQAAAGIKAAGASDVDASIAVLRDAYDRLESGGGITSTKNDALSNASAALSSSGVGTTFGKTFGTNNQSARNDIAMSRPALLAAMMKATGMSAKQMDSNAELKMWMATATDPTLDVESNRRALANIERKYMAQQGMQKDTQATNPQDAQAMEWAKSNPNDPRAKAIMQRLGGK
jgi:hypothetical protein